MSGTIGNFYVSMFPAVKLNWTIKTLNMEDVVNLRRLASRSDIQCTKDLVMAYNHEEDANCRKLIRHWLENYLQWFSMTEDAHLSVEDISSVSEIVNLQNGGDQMSYPEEVHLKTQLFSSICDRVVRCKLSQSHFIEALDHILHSLDAKVYENKTQELQRVANALCTKLQEARLGPLTKQTFSTLVTLLFALHSTLVLLCKLDTDQSHSKLFQDFRNQINVLKISNDYFPLVVYLELVKESLQNLFNSRSQDHLVGIARFLFYNSRETLYGRACLVEVTLVDLDQSMSVSHTESVSEGWRDGLLKIFQAYKLSIDEQNLQPFVNAFERPSYHSGSWSIFDSHSMLRFLWILHLHILATNCSQSNLKNEAIQLLLDEGKRAIETSNSEDPDIFEALLDSLHAIHKIPNNRGNISEVLRRMISTEDANLVMKAKMWADGQTLDEKLISLPSEQEVIKTDGLFGAIKQMMGILLTSRDRNDHLTSLRKRYKQPSFTKVNIAFITRKFKIFLKVVAMFDAEKPQNVKKLEWTIFRRKPDSEPTEEVGLAQLFDGLCEQNLKHLLLTGSIGTGKTSLCKRIVHEWANEGLFTNFQSIYFVPVANLNGVKHSRDEKKEASAEKEVFADEIMQCCFSCPRSKLDYEKSKIQVMDDLEKSTTLLILDGCEDANEIGKGLLGSFMQLDCKILLTSRPCSFVFSLLNDKSESIMMLNCVGFKKNQMANFFHSELCGQSHVKLELFLERYSPLKPIMQIPFVATIVCRLWEEVFAEGQEIQLSLYSIFSQIVQWMLARFFQRSELQALSRDVVSEALEKIAFGVPPDTSFDFDDFLMMMPDNDSEILQKCGFLVLTMNEKCFRFIDSSFHGFFTGRYITRQLFLGNPNQKKNLETYVNENKYSPDFKLILTLMSQEACHAYGSEGLEKILNVIDQNPRAITGMPHILLQLGILDSCLPMVDISSIHAFEIWNRIKEKVAVLLELSQNQVLSLIIPKLNQFPNFLSAWNLTTLKPPIIHPEAVQISIRTFESASASGTNSNDATIHRQNVSEFEGLSVEEKLMTGKESITIPSSSNSEAIQRRIMHSNRRSEIAIEGNALKDIPKERDSDLRRMNIYEHSVGNVGTRLPRTNEPQKITRRRKEKSERREISHLWKQISDLLEKAEVICSSSDAEIMINEISKLAMANKNVGSEAFNVLKQLIQFGQADAQHAVTVNLGNFANAEKYVAHEALEMLEKLSKNEDVLVRGAAISQLGNFANAEEYVAHGALRILEKLSVNEDISARDTAFFQIGMFAYFKTHLAHEALGILERLSINEDVSIREVVVSVLGNFANAKKYVAFRAVKILEKFSMDEAVSMRKAAIFVLGNFAQTERDVACEAMKILEKLSSDKEVSMQKAVISALGNFVKAERDVAYQVFGILKRLSTNENNSVHETAISQLGKLANASKYVHRALGILEKLSTNEVISVRDATFFQLGKLAKAKGYVAHPALKILKKLSINENIPIRDAAIFQLGNFAKAERIIAFEALGRLKKLSRKKDISVYEAAISQIGNFANADTYVAFEALEILEKLLTNKPISMRRAAICQLGKFASAERDVARQALEILEKHSLNKNISLHEAAISQLRHFTNSERTSALRALRILKKFSTKENISMHETVISVLSNFVNTERDIAFEAFKILERLSMDKEVFMLEAASHLLGNYTNAEAYVSYEALGLLERLSTNQNASISDAAITTIGKFATAEKYVAYKALEILERFSMNKDISKRNIAIFCLGSFVNAEKYVAHEALRILEKLSTNQDVSVRDAATFHLRNFVNAEEHAPYKDLSILEGLLTNQTVPIREAAIVQLGNLAMITDEEDLWIMFLEACYNIKDVYSWSLEPIIKSMDHSSATVKSKSMKCLGSVSLKSFIEFFMNSQDHRIVRVIAERILSTPVTATKIGNEMGCLRIFEDNSKNEIKNTIEAIEQLIDIIHKYFKEHHPDLDRILGPINSLYGENDDELGSEEISSNSVVHGI